jgi:(1->4)-alpha-D-glucan 1-alpha-D-glucosylmutase
VDYEARRRLLAELKADVASAGDDRRALAEALARAKEDGRAKLYVTWQGLSCRRDHPGLFSTGAYVPLETAGPLGEHAFAFLRRQGDTRAIVVVPRLLTRLVSEAAALPLGALVWDDSRVVLPPESGRSFRNVFTGERLATAARDDQAGLALAEVLKHFPVALLLAE